MTLKTAAISTLGLAAALTLAPAPAQAQHYRQVRTQELYRLPGTNTRVWPAPRAIIRSGGSTIYVMPNSGNCNPWPYGYSSGYSWPYGYSNDYSWPYGSSSRTRRTYNRHW